MVASWVSGYGGYSHPGFKSSSCSFSLFSFLLERVDFQLNFHNVRMYNIVIRCFTQNMRYVANGGEWSQMFVEALEEYESDNFDGSLLKYLLLGELGYEKAQSNAAHILETYHLEFVSNEEDNFRRSLMMWKRAAAHGKLNVFVVYSRYWSFVAAF